MPIRLIKRNIGEHLYMLTSIKTASGNFLVKFASSSVKPHICIVFPIFVPVDSQITFYFNKYCKCWTEMKVHVRPNNYCWLGRADKFYLSNFLLTFVIHLLTLQLECMLIRLGQNGWIGWSENLILSTSRNIPLLTTVTHGYYPHSWALLCYKVINKKLMYN